MVRSEFSSHSFANTRTLKENGREEKPMRGRSYIKTLPWVAKGVRLFKEVLGEGRKGGFRKKNKCQLGKRCGTGDSVLLRGLEEGPR